MSEMPILTSLYILSVKEYMRLPKNYKGVVKMSEQNDVEIDEKFEIKLAREYAISIKMIAEIAKKKPSDVIRCLIYHDLDSLINEIHTIC